MSSTLVSNHWRLTWCWPGHRRDSCPCGSSSWTCCPSQARALQKATTPGRREWRTALCSRYLLCSCPADIQPTGWSPLQLLFGIKVIDHHHEILPRNVSNVVESGWGFSSFRLTRGVMVNRGGFSEQVRLFTEFSPSWLWDWEEAGMLWSGVRNVLGSRLWLEDVEVVSRSGDRGRREEKP